MGRILAPMGVCHYKHKDNKYQNKASVLAPALWFLVGVDFEEMWRLVWNKEF